MNTGWLKYNISYLPLVSSAKCKFKSIKSDDTAAKAATASQDMSINDASQTVDGNAAAADNTNAITNAVAPSAAAPDAAADAAAAAVDDAASAADANPPAKSA